MDGQRREPKPKRKAGNPQLEDGYTRIAHELIEALGFCQELNPTARLVLTVARWTYGEDRKEWRTTYAELGKLANIGRTHIRKRCADAAKAKLLNVTDADGAIPGLPSPVVLSLKKAWADWPGMKGWTQPQPRDRRFKRNPAGNGTVTNQVTPEGDCYRAGNTTVTESVTGCNPAGNGTVTQQVTGCNPDGNTHPPQPQQNGGSAAPLRRADIDQTIKHPPNPPKVGGAGESKPAPSEPNTAAKWEAAQAHAVKLGATPWFDLLHRFTHCNYGDAKPDMLRFLNLPASVQREAIRQVEGEQAALRAGDKKYRPKSPARLLDALITASALVNRTSANPDDDPGMAALTAEAATIDARKAAGEDVTALLADYARRVNAYHMRRMEAA